MAMLTSITTSTAEVTATKRHSRAAAKATIEPSTRTNGREDQGQQTERVEPAARRCRAARTAAGALRLATARPPRPATVRARPARAGAETDRTPAASVWCTTMSTLRAPLVGACALGRAVARRRRRAAHGRRSSTSDPEGLEGHLTASTASSTSNTRRSSRRSPARQSRPELRPDQDAQRGGTA